MTYEIGADVPAHVVPPGIDPQLEAEDVGDLEEMPESDDDEQVDEGEQLQVAASVHGEAEQQVQPDLTQSTSVIPESTAADGKRARESSSSEEPGTGDATKKKDRQPVKKGRQDPDDEDEEMLV